MTQEEKILCFATKARHAWARVSITSNVVQESNLYFAASRTNTAAQKDTHVMVIISVQMRAKM